MIKSSEPPALCGTLMHLGGFQVTVSCGKRRGHHSAHQAEWVRGEDAGTAVWFEGDEIPRGVVVTNRWRAS